jgi:hypothetical protein
VSEQDQVRYDIGGWISGPCLGRPLNQPHGMSPEDATSLFHVRCIWGDRYCISYSGGQWKAHQLGAGAPWNLTADTAEMLQGHIWADYRQWAMEARRVERDAAPGGEGISTSDEEV